MINSIIAAIAASFLGKKNIIRWVTAVGVVAGAAAVGMSEVDFKAAMCGAPDVKTEEVK